MKCSTHSEADATSYCGYCGRALCGQCRRDVRGVSYCESCLALHMQSTTMGPFPPNSTGPQPGLALFLGFIPGVGAIYNGQIVKAIVEVLIFGSLIGLSDTVAGPFSTIFGLLAAAFYFYMVIDSYQTARRKQLGQPTEEWLGIGDARVGAPAGAVVLIILGALFLLDNLGVHIFADVGKFWPVILIVIGVFLLDRRMRRPAPPPSAGSSAEARPGAGPGSDPGVHESSSKEL